MDDNTKKGLACCGLILLIAIVAFAMFGGDKPVENKTVEIEGIKFDAPVTSNNTTYSIKTPTGGTTWTYEDGEHDITVYVCSERPAEYSVQEKYDSLNGYNQMRPIGDWWFVVCADRSADKDMVFDSAHMD